MNILVFPSGTEIGLEIARSIGHLNPHGASSIPDHGRIAYKKYHTLPFINDSNFYGSLLDLIHHEKIDALYPANDLVIKEFADHFENNMVIGSPAPTCQLAYSKELTYDYLRKIVKTPQIFTEPSDWCGMFVKPKTGHNSQHARRLEDGLPPNKDEIMMEYLPGPEYTVDCFTNQRRELLFVSPRKRIRTQNGISVNTAPFKSTKEFDSFAARLNKHIHFRGAWFFQVKRDGNGHLTLLEFAPRIAGSSGVQRFRGVNLPLLTYYDYIGQEVEIKPNNLSVELERSWDTKCICDLTYDNIYVDFDDCLCIDGKLNPTLVHFLTQCLNEGKSLRLISKHAGDLVNTASALKIVEFFTECIQVKEDEKKSKFIRPNSIFIDDSFMERKEVSEALGIPVFAPDAIGGLLR